MAVGDGAVDEPFHISPLVKLGYNFGMLLTGASQAYTSEGGMSFDLASPCHTPRTDVSITLAYQGAKSLHAVTSYARLRRPARLDTPSARGLGSRSPNDRSNGRST